VVASCVYTIVSSSAILLLAEMCLCLCLCDWPRLRARVCRRRRGLRPLCQLVNILLDYSLKTQNALLATVVRGSSSRAAAAAAGAEGGLVDPVQLEP